jgi:hypothetical protein
LGGEAAKTTEGISTPRLLLQDMAISLEMVDQSIKNMHPHNCIPHSKRDHSKRVCDSKQVFLIIKHRNREEIIEVCFERLYL